MAGPGRNGDVGFPFGQNGSIFPELNLLRLVSLQVLGAASANPFTPGAVYFLASFALSGVTMFLLSRSQGVNRLGAFMAGVLFANAPGHQERFEHLYPYWVVPIALWLVLEVARGRPLYTTTAQGRPTWRGSRSALTFAAILVVGLSGVYYVAFTLVLLAVAAIARRVVGAPKDLLNGLGIMMGLCLVIAVPLVLARVGTRGELVTGRLPSERLFLESERYAGKFMDLVLPYSGHRSTALESLTAAYRASTRATLEESALGVVGTVGMIALLASAVVALLGGRRLSSNVGRWAALLAVSLGLYSIGGLGSFIAFFLTAQVRAWSRMSVYILAISLLAVGWWLTGFRRRRGLIPAAVVCSLLVVVGSLDQTNPAKAPDYVASAAQMADVTKYTSALESRLGPGCAVFQLPVVPYPETPGPEMMRTYDQLLPYLSGSGLKFSYGAMRGTSAGDWMQAVPTDDAAALSEDLRSAGFCAIEVDTQGFATKTDPSRQLEQVLGPPIARTGDGTFVAFGLIGAGKGAEAAPEVRPRILHPLIATLNAYLIESRDGQVGQYVGPSSSLSLANLDDRQRMARVTMRVTGVGPSDRSVVVRDVADVELVRAQIPAGSHGDVAFETTLPAGRSAFTVQVSGPATKEREGDRTVSAWVSDMRITSAPGVRAVSLQEQVGSGWVLP